MCVRSNSFEKTRNTRLERTCSDWQTDSFPDASAMVCETCRADAVVVAAAAQ